MADGLFYHLPINVYRSAWLKLFFLTVLRNMLRLLLGADSSHLEFIMITSQIQDNAAEKQKRIK